MSEKYAISSSTVSLNEPDSKNDDGDGKFSGTQEKNDGLSNTPKTSNKTDHISSYFASIIGSDSSSDDSDGDFSENSKSNSAPQKVPKPGADHVSSYFESILGSDSSDDDDGDFYDDEEKQLNKDEKQLTNIANNEIKEIPLPEKSSKPNTSEKPKDAVTDYFKAMLAGFDGDDDDDDDDGDFYLASDSEDEKKKKTNKNPNVPSSNIYDPKVMPNITEPLQNLIRLIPPNSTASDALFQFGKTDPEKASQVSQSACQLLFYGQYDVYSRTVEQLKLDLNQILQKMSA